MAATHLLLGNLIRSDQVELQFGKLVMLSSRVMETMDIFCKNKQSSELFKRKTFKILLSTVEFIFGHEVFGNLTTIWTIL